MEPLYVLDVTYRTSVNGPGLRNTLHLAGCRIRCPGCFSKHTWERSAGAPQTPEEVAERLLRHNPQGVSISGGEPTDQIDGLLRLLHIVKRADLPLGILVFTGIAAGKLQKQPYWHELSSLVDAFVAGPYIEEEALFPVVGLRSSSNQALLLHPQRKLRQEMFTNLPTVEVQITSTGAKLLGFPRRGDVST